jgi:ubiquinol-cytochrome c reductase cytochrome c subunit
MRAVVTRVRLIAATLLVVAAGTFALTRVAEAGQAPIVRPAQEAGRSQLELGSQLFAANCATCHGTDGRGIGPPGNAQGASDVVGLGPSLHGVGALSADFYTRTGYMPLGDPHDQPVRSRVQFSDPERQALVRYVASLGGGPAVPRPDPAAGSVADGRRLFTDHCAGCHQVVAEGGILTGAKAPPLDRASPVEIAEAVRIGPYVMPKFSEAAISDDELDSIIAYVGYAKHPRDVGGWGINHLGPFSEGIVAWFIGALVLVAVCMLIGERARA